MDVPLPEYDAFRKKKIIQVIFQNLAPRKKSVQFFNDNNPGGYIFKTDSLMMPYNFFNREISEQNLVRSEISSKKDLALILTLAFYLVSIALNISQTSRTNPWPAVYPASHRKS